MGGFSTIFKAVGQANYICVCIPRALPSGGGWAYHPVIESSRTEARIVGGCDDSRIPTHRNFGEPRRGRTRHGCCTCYGTGSAETTYESPYLMSISYVSFSMK